MDTDDLYESCKAQLRDYIDREGLRHTQERDTLLRHICQSSQPFAVSELVEKGKNDHISQATVYNTLTLLVSARILHKVSGGSANHRSTLYELFTRQDARMEFVCRRCGRVVAFDDKILEDWVRAHKYNNFTPQTFSLYVYGECKTCKRKRKPKTIR